MKHEFVLNHLAVLLVFFTILITDYFCCSPSRSCNCAMFSGSFNSVCTCFCHSGSAIISLSCAWISGSFIISCISEMTAGSAIASFRFAMPTSARFISPFCCFAMFSNSHSRAAYFCACSWNSGSSIIFRISSKVFGSLASFLACSRTSSACFWNSGSDIISSIFFIVSGSLIMSFIFPITDGSLIALFKLSMARSASFIPPIAFAISSMSTPLAFICSAACFACSWKAGSAIIFWTSARYSGSLIIFFISSAMAGSFIAACAYAMPSSASFRSAFVAMSSSQSRGDCLCTRRPWPTQASNTERSAILSIAINMQMETSG
mmetsp:Transcript_31657/g.58397  ORF Transcript_31657/g.58397 Transcript_31657/m.58397 type:complete len:320 (-) Transcript_31657:61-1020(-)